MTWYVYELFDPRGGEAFYVGITQTPRRRLSQHGSDPASAAYQIVHALRRVGLTPLMKVESEHETRFAALCRENDMLVSGRDTLCNRGKPKAFMIEIGS